MRICILIYAPQKGLLASFAKELMVCGHSVVFAVRDTAVATVIRRHFPDLESDELVVLSDLVRPPIEDFSKECLRCEAEYGESFAMLAAHDRGFGKGYLFNVQGHPPILKASWSQDRKYEEILKEFIRYEETFDRLRPDLVIAVATSKVAHMVSRAKGIAVRVLTPPRFGSLYRWTEDETEGNHALALALDRCITDLSKASELPQTELEQTAFAQYFFSSRRYDYLSALKKVLARVAVESYQLLMRTHKRFRGGYEFLGWCGPLLRKPYIYRYLQRYGLRPEDIGDRKVVIFPLHAEPEASLLNLSPELNNSMELIAWVSKCLPADAVLVVKEHPDSIGLRPRIFYDNLRRMANVVIAHPSIHGKLWLGRCNLLANITSTMGFEAVAMERPVLSFGAHQVINRLPTVEYADNFRTTRQAVQKLLAPDPIRAHMLKVSRVSLDMAFKEVCFDLSGYESIFKSNDLHLDLARKALDGLQRELPLLNPAPQS